MFRGRRFVAGESGAALLIGEKKAIFFCATTARRSGHDQRKFIP
ncbi:MAG: hypothetical protein ABIL06_12620 [Pseudomonadota bacterium]